MRARDLLRFATKALTERKLRAALTIIGIVIGPATIVSLVGATQGYSNAATQRFSSLGATTIFVSPIGREATLTASDLPSIQSLSGVSYVLPYYELSGQISEGGTTSGVQVVAVDLANLTNVLPTLSLAQGSLPSSGNAVGAAIGYSVAYPDVQGANNVTVGQVVTVSNLGRSAFAFGVGGATSSSASTERSFVVDGIYSKFGQGFGVNPDTSIFIPLSSAELLLHSLDYTGVMVVASSPSTVNQVITEITNLYGQTMRVTSISSLLSSIQSVTQGTTTLLVAVGGTSVLVAFVGIMTTMLTSVVERTKEIGVLKALGSSSRGILAAFVAEAAVTGLIGGIIGAVLGFGLSYIVISFLSGSSLALGTGAARPVTTSASGARGAVGAAFGGGAAASSSTTLAIAPAVTPEIIVLAILLAVVVGTLGGLFPAWRASRLNPVEALRTS